MNRLYILIVSIVFFSCNSKIDKPKNGSSEKKIQKKVKTILRNDSEKNSSIIYDTLVFTEFMKGNSLDKKINESKDKLHFYKKFIKSSEINQLQIIDEKHTKTEIKYLGELKDIDNENSYKVITNFKIIGIGEMLSPRGRSEIAFIDSKNNIMVYDMGMPENLPNYIENNTLFFEIEKTKIGILISGGLAPILCLPKIGCNE
ncbi:hypothetical protein EQG63_08320 [Flavobacterium amnicola]|uniref:Lipoprotein n=1 Tax=Flavobacterium amnicola TaxID=2506422 RepID=A0A4Q1K1V8_9FLAO|nr:hypothetical protein [Flavobacterium amnicola]RXR18265.1 hypothetical protein EQG63_08320 [Flavobacterium amnicola]